jgi:lipoate-protein ligase A
MRLLGVSASFAPINDIVAQDGAVARKLSGNAQTRKRGCLLQHGTVLLDVDVERMFSLLKVPSEKLKGKLVEEVKARVTSLRRLLGRELPWAEAAATLAARYGAAFARLGVAVGEASGALDPAEEARARELAEGKYSSDAWNLKR